MTVITKMLISILTALAISCTANGQNSPPKPVKLVAPSYPEVMVLTKVAGNVILSLSVGSDGNVKKVHFIDGVRPRAKISEQAARKWIFPQTKRRSLRRVRVTFLYTLLPSTANIDEEGTFYYEPNYVELRARKVDVRP